MTTRQKTPATVYYELPPEQRPAMSTVDALGLYQDFLSRRLPIPEEVRLEAVRQANETVPNGYIAYPEEYQGRLRIVVTRKSDGGL